MSERKPAAERVRRRRQLKTEEGGDARARRESRPTMAASNKAVKVNATSKFTVLDVAGLKVDHSKAASKTGGHGGRAKTRLLDSSGPKIGGKGGAQGKIGGDFKVTKNPAFLAERNALFESIAARRAGEMAGADRAPIVVTLPDGKTVDGVAWETSPFDVAMGISKGLAEGNKAAVVAKVTYAAGARLPNPFGSVVAAPDEDHGSDDEDEEANEEAKAGGGGGGGGTTELWDMTRPLEGSCTLLFIKFEDDEGRMVFWHSSAVSRRPSTLRERGEERARDKAQLCSLPLPPSLSLSRFSPFFLFSFFFFFFFLSNVLFMRVFLHLFIPPITHSLIYRHAMHPSI